jgi:hypothetical protein
MKTYRTNLGSLTNQTLQKTIDVVTMIHADGTVQSYVEVTWESRDHRGWKRVGQEKKDTRTFGNASAAMSFYDTIN